MKKLFIYLLRITVFVFIGSALSFIFFASTSLYIYIGNIKTRAFFEKKYVKVTMIGELPDGYNVAVPHFEINGKYQDILSPKDLKMDSSYYVWYNSYMHRAYLTSKESTKFDVYKFTFSMKLAIVFFFLSFLTFYILKYIHNLLLHKYDIEE